MNDVDWLSLNKRNWDERTRIHLNARSYDLTALRNGRGRLHPIEEAELGSVSGLRVLHLQCHFGRDTLTLAQRGADVTGLDFSAAAVQTARQLADELGLASKARFVEANVYDALNAIPEPRSFDLVYVTWGAISWLPDLETWARIIFEFLKPGGRFYLAEGHPAALVFDDAQTPPGGMPNYFAPYFMTDMLMMNDSTDYADADACLENSEICEWMHSLSEIIMSLINAGLTLNWLHEHDSAPWPVFKLLVEDAHGMYRWPDKPWLPLSFSLEAYRP